MDTVRREATSRYGSKPLFEQFWFPLTNDTQSQQDAVYGAELMTGWAHPKMILSKLTVRALRDLGLSTDLSKADPFNITSAVTSGRRLRGRQLKKEKLENDVLEFPLTRLQGSLKPGRTADSEETG